MDPKISVIIPTKDRGELVARAIDCVLNQEYKDLQIIVVDDGSIDNTEEVLSRYDSVPNLCYIALNPPASGTAATGRNIGISCTTTDYVSFLDSDDEVTPDKFRIQMERMMADQEKMEKMPLGLQNLTTFHTHPEIDVCYTSMTVIEPDGSTRHSGSILSSFYGLHPNVVIPNVKENNGTNMTTGLFRKEIFRLIGGFKNIRIGEDSEFKDRLHAFGCNESYEDTGLYKYYIGTSQSLIKEANETVTEEKLAKRKSDALANAKYKRDMILCGDEAEFINRFGVTINLESIQVKKVHNSALLNLDERVPVTEKTKSILTELVSS